MTTKVSGHNKPDNIISSLLFVIWAVAAIDIIIGIKFSAIRIIIC